MDEPLEVPREATGSLAAWRERLQRRLLEITAEVDRTVSSGG